MGSKDNKQKQNKIKPDKIEKDKKVINLYFFGCQGIYLNKIRFNYGYREKYT